MDGLLALQSIPSVLVTFLTAVTKYLLKSKNAQFEGAFRGSGETWGKGGSGLWQQEGEVAGHTVFAVWTQREMILCV